MSIKPKKKFLWYWALCSAVTWGSSNFCYGLMTDRDFAANTLNFTATIPMMLIVKVWYVQQC